jgi:hypothetical protein
VNADAHGVVSPTCEAKTSRLGPVTRDSPPNAAAVASLIMSEKALLTENGFVARTLVIPSACHWPRRIGPQAGRPTGAPPPLLGSRRQNFRRCPFSLPGITPDDGASYATSDCLENLYFFSTRCRGRYDRISPLRPPLLLINPSSRSGTASPPVGCEVGFRFYDGAV